MTEKVNAYKELEKELNRTAVISQEFKSIILAWVQQEIYDAYHRGVEEGKRLVAIPTEEDDEDLNLKY